MSSAEKPLAPRVPIPDLMAKDGDLEKDIKDAALKKTPAGHPRVVIATDFAFTDLYGVACPLDFTGCPIIGCALLEGSGSTRVFFRVTGWDIKEIPDWAEEWASFPHGDYIICAKGDNTEFWLRESYSLYKTIGNTFVWKSSLALGIYRAIEQVGIDAKFDEVVSSFSLGSSTETKLIHNSEFVCTYLEKMDSNLSKCNFVTVLREKAKSIRDPFETPDEERWRRVSCHICKMVPKYPRGRKRTAEETKEAQAFICKCKCCTRHWCSVCLNAFFGMSMTGFKQDRDCAVCKGQCYCEPCRSKKSEPLAIARTIADAAGEHWKSFFNIKKKRSKPKGDKSDSESEPEKKKSKHSDDEGKEKHHHHHHHHKDKDKEKEKDKDKEKDKGKKDKKEEKKGDGKKQTSIVQFAFPKIKLDKIRKELEDMSKEERKKRVKKEDNPERKHVLELVIKEIENPPEEKSSSHTKTKEKIKYPVEDEEREEILRKKKKKPVPWPAPTRLTVTNEIDIGDLLTLWQFFESFSTIFTTAKAPTLLELATTFSSKPTEESCRWVSRVNVDMIKLLMKEEEEDSADVDIASVWEFARRRFEATMNAKDLERKVLAEELDAHDFFELTPARRLSLTRSLCDDLLGTEKFRTHIDSCLTELAEVRTAKKELQKEKRDEPEQVAVADESAMTRAQRAKITAEQRAARARDEKEKQLDARELRLASSVRTPHMGYDRRLRRYWLFEQQFLFIEDSADNAWFACTSREQYEGLMKWLDIKGIREKALDRMFAHAEQKVMDGLPALRKELGIQEGASPPELNLQAPPVPVPVPTSEEMSDVQQEAEAKDDLKDTSTAAQETPDAKGEKDETKSVSEQEKGSTKEAEAKSAPEKTDSAEDTQPMEVDSSSVGPVLQPRSLSLNLVADLIATIEEKLDPLQTTADFQLARPRWSTDLVRARSLQELASLLQGIANGIIPTAMDPQSGWPATGKEEWEASVSSARTPAQLAIAARHFQVLCPWIAICKVCKQGDLKARFIKCCYCKRSYHLSCIGMRARPQADWFCSQCKKHEEELASKSKEVCEVCSGGGKLLCCDKCPRVFHVSCVGLSRVPRGEWVCPYCQSQQAAATAAVTGDRGAKAAGRERMRAMAADENEEEDGDENEKAEKKGSSDDGYSSSDSSSSSSSSGGEDDEDGQNSSGSGSEQSDSSDSDAEEDAAPVRVTRSRSKRVQKTAAPPGMSTRTRSATRESVDRGSSPSAEVIARSRLGLRPISKRTYT